MEGDNNYSLERIACINPYLANNKRGKVYTYISSSVKLLPVYFNNQVNWEIPSIGVIDPETINTHDLCYQCSKYGPDCLVGKLKIKDFNDEPHFPEK